MQAVLLSQSLSPIIISILLGLFLGIVVYFWYVFEKEKRLLGKEEKALAAYEKILAKAHNDAREIIRKASKRAEHLLDNTAYVKKGATEQIQKKLTDETTTALRLYQKTAKVVEDETVASMQKSVNKIEEIAQEEMNTYRQTLATNVRTSREKIEKKALEDMGRLDEEIAEYKKEKLAVVDEQILTLARTLAQEVLGKSLSLEEHREYIQKALEQAQKEKVI